MKKILLILLVLILSIIAINFLLPSSKTFVIERSAKCAEASVARQFTNKINWKLWWPGEIKNDTMFYYKNCRYRVDKILLNGFLATVFSKQDSLKGFLQYIYEANDSTTFRWSATTKLSDNLFTKWSQNSQLNKIELNTNDLLEDIKIHFNTRDKVYGLNIKRETVSIPSYISTKNSFNHYPSTQDIYEMIESLNQYIVKMGGEEIKEPMLHVEFEGADVYEAMVAIPIKNELASTDKFKLKKMILGNILTAEVKGGSYKIIAGEQEFKNYIDDYKILSPAIPFQSLITNRLIEKDTTKWITKLNYPIFQ